MSILNHPAVQHAEAAIRSVMTAHPWMTTAQARNVVRVELTPHEAVKLISARDAEMLIVYNPDCEGPITVKGTAYYVVPRIRDGDTWRVINALGVN